MGWQDQGRQEHGWFGHGTAPQRTDDDSDDGGLFAAGGLDARIQAAGYAALAALPSSLRAPVARQFDAARVARLTGLMKAWISGARLDQAQFAAVFFGQAADDSVVGNLRATAQGADMAKSHGELREAAGRLAAVVQTVGLDRWSRFVADAQDRARDLATVAAVDKSLRPPDPARDAIRPVYPVETAIGIGAAGIAGSARAALRAGGGAILRQALPGNRPPAASAPEGSAESSAGRTEVIPSPAVQSVRLHEGQQAKHIEGSQNYDPTRSTLTADPQKLLDRFAGRGQQRGNVPVGQPGSKEVFDTGTEVIGVNRSRGGTSAQTTRGIIHYSNRGAHIVPAAPRK